jgi:hypothetical protein
MPRHPSFIRTERKQVFLAPEIRTTIQAWADREGLTFSAAIEALAQRELRRAPAGLPARTASVAAAIDATPDVIAPELD